MNKPTLREERLNDEIDLRIVFRKLASFFKNILIGIGNIFQLLLRRWPLVLFVTLVCIGLGFLAYKEKRPFYRSSLTLAPAEIRNEFFEAQAFRLSTLVMDGNVEMVAADLQIKPGDASKIKSLKYFNLNPASVSPDSILVGYPFRLEAELYDNMFFASFQKAIIGYFERNPFFSRNTQTRREQLQSMITKLKLDIQSIDSIKRTAVNLRGPANGFVYGEPLDPTALYKQSAELFEKQAFLEAQLRRLETIQVVVDFAPIIHPSGPKLKWHLVIGALLGLGLSLLLALKLEYHKIKRGRVTRES